MQARGSDTPYPDLTLGALGELGPDARHARGAMFTFVPVAFPEPRRFGDTEDRPSLLFELRLTARDPTQAQSPSDARFRDTLAFFRT